MACDFGAHLHGVDEYDGTFFTSSGDELETILKP
jgi:hypothetical protein